MTYRKRRALGLVTPRPRHAEPLREEIITRYLTAGTRIGWRGKPQRAVRQTQLAREYGLSSSTISRWITQALAQ
jgi:transposase-like protein